MAKANLTKVFSTDNGLFKGLEDYLEFCKSHGYKYNEADINHMRSYAFQQYTKYVQGKNAKNMWEEDAIRFNLNI
jgi:hypothetical protein